VVAPTIEGLGTGIVSGKAAFSSTDRPRLSEPLIATNLDRPSCFRCSLHFINSIACLNN